jgi:hypothetical protein
LDFSVLNIVWDLSVAADGTLNILLRPLAAKLKNIPVRYLKKPHPAEYSARVR